MCHTMLTQSLGFSTEASARPLVLVQSSLVKTIIVIGLCIRISSFIGADEYHRIMQLPGFGSHDASTTFLLRLGLTRQGARREYVYDPNHHPVCTPRILDPSKYDEIYLLHMRKAGGTTLRTYLTKVAAKYNITFRATEGKPDVTTSPLSTPNGVAAAAAAARKAVRVFRVTNLRHRRGSNTSSYPGAIEARQ